MRSGKTLKLCLDDQKWIIAGDESASRCKGAVVAPLRVLNDAEASDQLHKEPPGPIATKRGALPNEPFSHAIGWCQIVCE